MVENEEVVATYGRRWCFTINNPLGTDIQEVDISKTDLEIKEDYYPLDVLQEMENSGYFIFKYIKISIQVDDFASKDIIIKRPYFKDLESAELYFKSLEHFKYCIFQLEKGEEEHTQHFQGYIVFNIGKRFQTIKKYFPFAHLEKAKGSGSQCRDYCSKKDTRVAGPFEIGTFTEQGTRTDISNFMEMIRAGVDEEDLARLFPTLFLREKNKIQSIYAMNFNKYKTQCRDVKVTYIYGKSGVGKSTYIRKKYGVKESFWIHNYDNSMFTNYNYQDTIVFDEFSGDIKISAINMLLNVEPVELRGLNSSRYGCYHNVYIVSNYSPDELYRDIQKTQPEIFKTFKRRLNTIIRMESGGKMVYERITEWEDCTDEVDKELGLTQQTKKVWDIDKYGNKIVVFDRYSQVPDGLTLVEDVNNPFDITDKSGNLKF